MWPIFATLLQTLRGAPSGNALSVRPAGANPPAAPFAFEAEWAGLLARLNLPPDVLREVAARGALEPHFRYRRFSRPKRDGGRRELAAPDPRLKRLQYEIVIRHLAAEQPHPAAVAYQKGKSTVDHIWAHAGAAVIVIADVKDFFPNTRAERVEDWWRERVDADTARLLTLLTTDRGGLPQGASTSPPLSNLVNRELDTRLAQRAAVAGARYTRYCDDLAFSWPLGAAVKPGFAGDRSRVQQWGVPSGFEPGVRAVLHEYGYALHPTKGWRIYDRRDEPEVTGVVLTRSGGVRLPDRIRRVMRELACSANPRDAERLAGYEGYAKMVTRRPKRQKQKPAPKPLGPRPTTAGDEIPF